MDSKAEEKMKRFEIKAKLYEMIQTKMMRVPITPDTAFERFRDALIINYKDIRASFTGEQMYSILTNTSLPSPNRKCDEPADEAMAIVDTIFSEELTDLTDYISKKLNDIFEHDFGGIRFALAILDYKNISSLTDDERDSFDEPDEKVFNILYELVSAESIESEVVSGLKINIIQTPSTKKTFGRVNIAGMDMLLLRESKHDEYGRHLSIVES